MMSFPGVRFCAAFLVSCVGATPLAALDRIEFQAPGADEELTRDLRAASLLISAQTEGTTDPQELLASALADYGRLVGALYAEGRFGGIINILIDGREAAGIPPLNPPDSIGVITVTVQPGPQYRFSQTDVRPQAPRTELPDGFVVGQPARTPVIRDGVEAVVDGWRAQGRAKAEVASQRVTAQHPSEQVAVDVGIAPGPVVRFGELRLEGGETVSPRRLRKIAGLPTGAVFDPDEVEQATRRLRRTGVFAAVALSEAETLGPGNTLDITATLDEEQPRRVGFGAEISSVDGLSLSGFWMHRNLLGGAERLRLEGDIGSIGFGTGGTDYRFSARYSRPATPDADTDAFLLAEVERLEEPEFTSDTGRFGLGFTRYQTERLTYELGLAYVFSDETDATGSNRYHLLTLPLGARYESRDTALDATEGVFADVDLMPFAGFKDTDSGARLAFDARTYVGFGEDNRFVLAGRVQGGSILGADLDGVPNDYRFYSGGGGSVRGQEYQSLGVELDGNKTGGRSFLGLSGEVRARVRDNIGVVAFADFGHVGEDSFGGNGDSHGGAGLGLRYLTPIGPIRLDVAAPIGGTSDGAQVYIGIGQAF